MFIKIVVIFVSILLISFIQYSEPYYFLCKTIVDNNSNTIIPLFERPSFNKEKFESFNHTCQNFYTDYSNHTVMKYTINKIITVLYSERKYANVNVIENIINRTDLGHMKLILGISKLILLFAYVSILYLIIVLMPSKVANWAPSVMNKVLYVFFGFLFVEGIARAYLSINIDIINFIETHQGQVFAFMPIHYLLRFIKWIFNWIFKAK